MTTRKRSRFSRNSWIVKAADLLAAQGDGILTNIILQEATYLALEYFDPKPNKFTPLEAIRKDRK